MGVTVLLDKDLIEQTKAWVDKVIIGLGFCPFAKPVIDAKTARFMVFNEAGFEAGLNCLMSELERLDKLPEVETTLMILPTGFESFDHYLDFVALGERLLADEGYEGVYQLASFHPDYCFNGAKQDDPANYTNRSPYPLLHLIREASIERVLEPIEHPDDIPERNINHARELGLDTMRGLLEESFKLN